MDIKLRAKLSAYSKVSALTQSGGGVDNIEIVTREEIDSLFKNASQDEIVSKADIDTLFDSEDPDEIELVSHSDIDSLFHK